MTTKEILNELKDFGNEGTKKIGKVDVDVGGTACKVHLATDYIKKVVDRGNIGKKRKAARC